ncbi:MAG: DNA-directed RNA polymerase subunit omega [Acidobacteria bacterium]|nr:MAG: DNA-directed RNA polymerase subunit omega [Acidobacteriota bacterium]REK01045.1 MAG: DNA-directed RNA polymerase subunit omega [Acidobacteriota bacterium]
MDIIDQHVDSKFRFVLLSAQRAEQLLRGAPPRVEVRSPKVARTAMEELITGQIDWDYGPRPSEAGEGAEEE